MTLADVLNQSAAQAALLAPLIVGMVQGYKTCRLWDDSYSFPAAIATGVLLAQLVNLVGGGQADVPSVAQACMTGLCAGLTASGAYSGYRAYIPPKAA